MKVFFATPCYRSDPLVAAAWAHRQATALNLQAEFSSVTNCACVDLARETLVVNFMESKCDYLLFRDDDIDCAPELIERMLFLRRPVVTAPYRKKFAEKVVWATDGLGLTLLHKTVIARLLFAYSSLEYIVEGRSHTGLFDSLYNYDVDGGKRTKLREDGAFFYRVRALSYDVVKVTPAKVIHGGLESVWT